MGHRPTSNRVWEAKEGADNEGCAHPVEGRYSPTVFSTLILPYG